MQRAQTRAARVADAASALLGMALLLAGAAVVALLLAGCVIRSTHQWNTGGSVAETIVVEPQFTPIYSSDGSWVIIADRRYMGDVYLVSSDGSEIISVFKTGMRPGVYAFEFSPDISPDGARLVYASSRHEVPIDESDSTLPVKEFARSSEIETSDLNGKNRKRLTKSTSLKTAPAWSPSGDAIAFVEYYNSIGLTGDDLALKGVYVMSSDESSVHPVYQAQVAPRRTYASSTKVMGALSWSPDGNHIAFTLGEIALDSLEDVYYGNRIYVANSDGSGWAELATGDHLTAPVWSPDGIRIAFAENEMGMEGVYIIRPDGTDLQQVHAHKAARVAWSPDSSELLINGGYVMNAHGTGRGRLIAPLYEHNRGAWSPDGSRIAIYRPWEPTSPYEPDMPAVLFTVGSDGADARVLAVRDEDTGAWHECGLSSAEDGLEHCEPEGIAPPR